MWSSFLLLGVKFGTYGENGGILAGRPRVCNNLHKKYGEFSVIRFPIRYCIYTRVMIE